MRWLHWSPLLPDGQSLACALCLGNPGPPVPLQGALPSAVSGSLLESQPCHPLATISSLSWALRAWRKTWHFFFGLSNLLTWCWLLSPAPQDTEGWLGYCLNEGPTVPAGWMTSEERSGAGLRSRARFMASGLWRLDPGQRQRPLDPGCVAHSSAWKAEDECWLLPPGDQWNPLSQDVFPVSESNCKSLVF